jgi:hypothetical protein
VEYYNGWHKIGESSLPPFSFEWKNIPFGEIKLKAICYDIEGASQSSSIITLDSKIITGLEETEDQVSIVRVFPNPARKEINFEIEDKPASGIIIDLYSIQGKHILQIGKNSLEPGSNTICVPLKKRINPGLYFYSIRLNNNEAMKVISGKFLVESE